MTLRILLDHVTHVVRLASLLQEKTFVVQGRKFHPKVGKSGDFLPLRPFLLRPLVRGTVFHCMLPLLHLSDSIHLSLSSWISSPLSFLSQFLISLVQCPPPAHFRHRPNCCYILRVHSPPSFTLPFLASPFLLPKNTMVEPWLNRSFGYGNSTTWLTMVMINHMVEPW